MDYAIFHVFWQKEKRKTVTQVKASDELDVENQKERGVT